MSDCDYIRGMALRRVADVGYLVRAKLRSKFLDKGVLKLGLSPSRLFPSGFGMPAELFLTADLYLALDDLDRFGNRLLGIRGVRLCDKKLHIVADLKSRKTFLSGYTFCNKEIFRPVLYRRDEPTKSLVVQLRDEAMFKGFTIGGATRIARPRI